MLDIIPRPHCNICAQKIEMIPSEDEHLSHCYASSTKSYHVNCLTKNCFYLNTAAAAAAFFKGTIVKHENNEQSVALRFDNGISWEIVPGKKMYVEKNNDFAFIETPQQFKNDYFSKIRQAHNWSLCTFPTAPPAYTISMIHFGTKTIISNWRLEDLILKNIFSSETPDLSLYTRNSAHNSVTVYFSGFSMPRAKKRQATICGMYLEIATRHTALFAYGADKKVSILDIQKLPANYKLHKTISRFAITLVRVSKRLRGQKAVIQRLIFDFLDSEAGWVGTDSIPNMVVKVSENE